MVEKGTHQELLALNGRYASMWEKHCRAERAAEHARDATRKARKLLCQANISRGDENSDGYSSMVSSTILPTRVNSPTAPGSTKGSSSDDSKSDSESISSRDSNHGSEGTLRDESCEESRPDEMADDEYSPTDEVDEPLARLQDASSQNQNPYTSRSPPTRPSLL